MKDRDPLTVAAAPTSRRPAFDDDGDFDLKTLFRRIARRRKTMALITAGVFVIGVAYSLTRPADYRSTARLLVSPVKRPGLLSTAAAGMASDLQSLFGSKSAETEAELLSDDQLVQEAYDSLSPKERKIGFGGEKKLPDGTVKVTPKRGTDVVEISVTSHSPTVSAHLSNAIVRSYFEKDFDESSNSTRKARRYAESRMRFINAQLIDANKKLAEFKQRNHLIAPDVQLEKLTAYVVNLQTELNSAIVQQAACVREVSTLEREISRQSPNVVSGDIIKQNPRFAAIAANLDTLYSKRIELLQEYQPQSPEIRSLDKQIGQEEARLKQTTERITESLAHSRNTIRDQLTASYATTLAKQAATNAGIGVLKRAIAEQNAVADTLPEKERQFMELRGKVDMLARAYGLISDQYYGLLLTEQQNIPRAQVVAGAIPDPDPVSPSLPKRGITYLFLGAVVAAAWALAAEMMDPRVRDKESAEAAARLYVSAVIPSAAGGASPFIARSRPSAEMLCGFRMLRNSVYSGGIERQLRVIAVTSAGRGEGKTLVSANLAAVMAMDGKSVAVIDCNMDHPNIGEFIGRHDLGLTDVLSGRCQVDKALAQGDQQNLSLLASGPGVWNFPELLNSENGKKAFRQLREQFDYVLLDCPSVENLADLQMISTLADGILLVVRLEKTLVPRLKAAASSLANLSIPVIGLVLNDHENQVGPANSPFNKGAVGDSAVGTAKAGAER